MDRLRLPVLRSGACALVAAAGLAVAGCGGDDGGTTSTVASTPRTTSTATTTEATTGGTTTTTPSPGGTTTRRDPSPEPEAPLTEKQAFPDLVPLRKVPQAGDRSPDARTVAIAERWFAAIRRGRAGEAADLMADGTRYSNVYTAQLSDRAARLAVSDDLPCGAVPTEVAGARGGYVVLTLKLVDKAGEPPCDGAGAPVAVSLHVTDGKIDDWVRVVAADAPINKGAPA
ncbi:hypothetical protein [Patulibacter minatonensis]|uniref:hypothetical protein n=1 Tax=Patulibacter minatonensis TaxID=298163 RepID=UPI00047B26C5|nr:hypothetical protein [Patulibacter minatonensis]